MAARNLTILRDWSKGGVGLPIPDATHPNIRLVLENMQNDINQLRGGLAITTPDAVDAGTTQTLAQAIKVALNAVAAQTPYVVFDPTPAGAQY